MLRRLISAWLMMVLMVVPALGTIFSPTPVSHGQQGALARKEATSRHSCCPKLHTVLPLNLPQPATPCGDQHRCCFLSGPDTTPALLSEAQPSPQLYRTEPGLALPLLLVRSMTSDKSVADASRSYSDFSMIARN